MMRLFLRPAELFAGPGWSSAAGLACALLLCPSRARADSAEDPIHLDWRAPDGCPTQAEVRKKVGAMLGGVRSPKAARRISARGVIVERTDPSEPRYFMELSTETEGARGHRTLASASCSELGSAAAVIVALAFDPEVLTRQAALPERLEPSVALRGRVVPRTAPRAWRIGAGAIIAGDLGALPHADLAFGLSVALLLRRLRVEASAHFWLREEAEGPRQPGKGGRFDFVSGALAGCVRFHPPVVELEACGNVELGWMRARGYGVSDPGENELFWLAPGLMGRAMAPLGDRLAIGAGLGFVVPVFRPTWTLTGIGPVDRSSAVSARGTVAAEVRF
jgi:hypothetical protein